MEKDGAGEMFLRSLEKHQLKYTEYVGDADTNSFGTVQEALDEKYGDAYQIVKEKMVRAIFYHMMLGPMNVLLTNTYIAQIEMIAGASTKRIMHVTLTDMIKQNVCRFVKSSNQSLIGSHLRSCSNHVRRALPKTKMKQ